MSVYTRRPLAVDLDVEPPKKKARKRPKATTPMSIEKLRAEGYYAEKVEQRLPIPGAFVTKDWGGFADILAVSESLGVLLVQTTAGSGGNAAARMRKMEEPPVSDVIARCLRAGVRVHVHHWAKRGLRGEKKTYTCRVVSARLGASSTIEWEEKRDG
jgi:hypothetical protein